MWIIPIALILFSASSALGGETGVTVYLKWHLQTQPRLESGKWTTGAAALDEILRNFNLCRVEPALRQTRTADPFGLKRVLRLELDRAGEVAPLLTALRDLPGTKYAEEMPDRRTCYAGGGSPLRQTMNVPIDPLYAEQWFFPVMQAPSAWDLTHGSSSVVVAIVDNGTDLGHPDLAASIWNNADEISGNGVDDDGNGFIDDVNGWDFEDNDNNPEPEPPGDPDYHGTHTAGLVGSVMDNGRGVTGIAPSCKVMVVRAGSGGFINSGLEGILYAAYNGADVISLSWGGTGSSSFEQDVINDALLQGAVIVAAAGNEGSTTHHYPAAYDGVLAVAATDPADHLWDGSNHGSWVSVCAPGVAILSLVPDGYGMASGTSMATPLVAGVAALVKSYHPGWTGDQIYSQIIYTSDDISAKNPLYPGMLGTGRVNAYRAVAETAPGIQVAGVVVTETSGDGDGRLDPGETASLELSLQNMGETTGNVQVSLTSGDAYVQVNQGEWSFAEFSAGQILNNSAEINILLGSDTNREVQLDVSVVSENFYAASLKAPIWIDPAFADHNTGNVAFTVTEFGAFGYYNYTHSEHHGSGFRYPPEGSNALYHGSLMAGTSTAKVSDCAYGTNALPYRYDWETDADGEISMTSGLQADQEGFAVYQDTGPPPSEQVGLKVTQQSYAWTDAPNDDFVIISFSLENVSGSTLTDLYVGLYMDWDLINYDDNEANWDQNLALGYVYNAQVLAPNTRYYGTSLLSQNLASYRVIDNFAVPPMQTTDAQKYQWMSSGFVDTASTGPSDYVILLSAGPFTLEPDSVEQVVFAVFGGEDLIDLQANVTAAQTIWSSLTESLLTGPSSSLGKASIGDVFPRPANGALRLQLNLPGPGEVSFDLIDLLGRSTPVWQGSFTEAGSHTITISDWNGASGIYFLRGTTPYGSVSTRIVWLK
jgi:subtilisin family serine protease